MKLRHITITNFRSFRGTQTFTFPEGPGLYFLWGENREEPRLEANGSGKTSLWEALTWLFYAKTSRGLKAGEVSSWDVGKGTVVELEADVGSLPVTWIVRRSWSPNSWTLDNGSGEPQDLTKDSTNEVLDELRLGFQSFLSCVLMAQGQPMFLDLKPPEKASLFAEVMDLDRWLTYSQRASDLARKEDTEARRLEAGIARGEGQIDAWRRMDTAKQVEEWELTRSDRRAGIERVYTENLDRLKRLEGDEVDAKREAENARILLREEAARAEAHTTHCKTCGQELPNTPARRELARLVAMVDDAERKVRNTRRDIELLERELDALEEKDAALAKEVNPYKRADDDRLQQIKDGEANVRVMRQVLDSVLERYSLYTNWVRWFKEIRLARIADALEQLEIEVNSCLNALGLVSWELYFDIDRETKSGTVQRGFTVTVQSPHNARAVPWEAWSGGESQRLRLAANMGLANLIRARTGASINIEVWDEPTQWMSGQGVQDLLESLVQRAQETQRQIWVVDHRTLGFAGFKQSRGVVKTAKGSMFVDEQEARLGQALDNPPRRRSALPKLPAEPSHRRKA